MNIPYAPVSFTSRCHLRAVVIYESVVHAIYEFEKFFSSVFSNKSQKIPFKKKFFVHVIYNRQKKKSVVNDTGAYGICFFDL